MRSIAQTTGINSTTRTNYGGTANEARLRIRAVAGPGRRWAVSEQDRMSDREALRFELGFHVPRPDFDTGEWVCLVCGQCVGSVRILIEDDRPTCPGKTDA